VHLSPCYVRNPSWLQQVLRAKGLESTPLHRFWNSPGPPKVPLLAPVLCVLGTALALAGCGGSSSGAGSDANARTLLRQTFSGAHPINSGRLAVSLSLDPTGSSVLTQPVTLSFAGPFQSRGRNRTPESDYQIAIGFEGHTGQLGILSTGTAGFVTLQGNAYQLPASSFKQLEDSVPGVGGGSGSSSTLSALGIHPQQWLTGPEMVGTSRVGGTLTDHIHGKLALRPLLADLSKLLGRASNATSRTGTASLGSLSPARQAQIAAEITGASFDLWTGTRDHTIRRLSVTGSLPVSGTTQTELGGLTRAKFTFSLAYSDIGQTETVTAPSSAKPYSQFETRLRSIVLEIEELVVGATGSASSTTAGSSTTSSSGGAASSGDSAYSSCVSAAGSSVAKIQKCAALLNGGG
jgi:hypothetical protein